MATRDFGCGTERVVCSVYNCIIIVYKCSLMYTNVYKCSNQIYRSIVRVDPLIYSSSTCDKVYIFLYVLCVYPGSACLVTVILHAKSELTITIFRVLLKLYNSNLYSDFKRNRCAGKYRWIQVIKYNK